MTMPDDALRAAGWDVYTVANDSADHIPHAVELRYEDRAGCVSLTMTLAPSEARALATHLLAEADLAEAQDAPPPPDPSSCTHDWDVMAWTGLLNEACGRLYIRAECRHCGTVSQGDAPVGARVGARLPGQGVLQTPKRQP